MTVTADSIVLSKPRTQPRQGGAEASQQLAQSADDHLIWPELGNEDDINLVWGNENDEK